jgi:hypothetical protein
MEDKRLPEPEFSLVEEPISSPYLDSLQPRPSGFIPADPVEAGVLFLENWALMNPLLAPEEMPQPSPEAARALKGIEESGMCNEYQGYCRRLFSTFLGESLESVPTAWTHAQPGQIVHVIHRHSGIGRIDEYDDGKTVPALIIGRASGYNYCNCLTLQGRQYSELQLEQEDWIRPATPQEIASFFKELNKPLEDPNRESTRRGSIADLTALLMRTPLS